MKRKVLTSKEYKHKLLVYMPYVVLHVLLRNKALDLYCNNARNIKVDSFLRRYRSCRQPCPLMWINDTFWWEDTPEGLEFWADIFNQAVAEMNRQLMKLTKKRKQQLRHNLIVDMPYSLLHTLLHFKVLSKFLEYSLTYYPTFFPENYDCKYKEWNGNGYIWLTGMFPWGRTEEGLRYWINVSDWLREHRDSL